MRLLVGRPPPKSPRERARLRAVARGSAAGLLLMAFASVVRLPLLVLSPGPTYNTIGEVDGRPMIEISGQETFPTQGALDMTTILERGGSSGGVQLGEALAGWISPRAMVVPREAFYGPDTTGEEIEQENDQLFALSQSDAIAASMGELGIPTEESVVVTLVDGGTPADGIVQAGDEIRRVDGRPVDAPEDVGRAVRAKEVGDTVVLDVRRVETPGADPVRKRLEVVAAANPDPPAGQDPRAPYLGIAVGTAHEAPFDIEFTLEDVGGPSAGLMFSLAIVDKLTEGSLTGGGHVAGTGTIDPEGVVGPIGGIVQKLAGAKDAGASLFLMPEGNCSEAAGKVPDGMAVAAVGTLAQARDVVEAWSKDPATDLPACPTA